MARRNYNSQKRKKLPCCKSLKCKAHEIHQLLYLLTSSNTKKRHRNTTRDKTQHNSTTKRNTTQQLNIKQQSSYKHYIRGGSLIKLTQVLITLVLICVFNV